MLTHTLQASKKIIKSPPQKVLTQNKELRNETSITQPFIITKIEGEEARLDYYANSVPLTELSLVE